MLHVEFITVALSQVHCMDTFVAEHMPASARISQRVAQL
jgi:hypothetical protein